MCALTTSTGKQIVPHLVFPEVCCRGDLRRHRRRTWSGSLRWSSSASCSTIHWFKKIDKHRHSHSVREIGNLSVVAEGNHLPSVVHLMLAERSLRSGPGSMVGRPVAEVVVVQVDEILLSNPGGRLRLNRCRWQR